MSLQCLLIFMRFARPGTADYEASRTGDLELGSWRGDHYAIWLSHSLWLVVSA